MSVSAIDAAGSTWPKLIIEALARLISVHDTRGICA